MIKYKRYRWKRRVNNTKWVATKNNGWANVDTLSNVTARRSYYGSNDWEISATTASGNSVGLKMPRSVREDLPSLTRSKDVVSRYLKWVHAIPESSETVNVREPVTDPEPNEVLEEESEELV